MKPWAAAQNLLVMHGAKYFMTGLKPMDLTIPMNAKAAGKETGALETPEEQIAVFESLTIEEQVRMLEKTADMIVKDRKEGTDSIAKLIEVYLAGDVEAMAEFATTFGGEPDELDRKFMKALIDDRNATMKKRLLAKMKEKKGKTWFVAVGAAHHWGEKGLPALLEAEGFEVERVRGG